MTPEQARLEWVDFAEEWANDNSKFTDSEPEVDAFLEGIESYQSSLKELIESYKVLGRVGLVGTTYNEALEKVLELLTTVTPKKK